MSFWGSMHLIVQKTSVTDITFLSEGQYDGCRVEMFCRLLVAIVLTKSLTFYIISRDPRNRCSAMKSPPERILFLRKLKYSSYCSFCCRAWGRNCELAQLLFSGDTAVLQMFFA